MGKDGSYIIDTKIDTSSLPADLKNVAKQFDKMADSADNIEKEVKKSFESVSDSAKKAYSKIENIRTDDLDDNKLKADKIAETYQELGEAQSEAMQKAWDTVKSESDTGTKQVIDGLDEIGDAAEKASDQIGDIPDDFDKIGDSAKKTGQKVRNSFDGAFNEMFQANLMADLIGDGFAQLGETILDVAKDSIQAAADIKAANAQFEQTFHGVEKTARESLNAIADQTGITASRMQDSYTSIYAFLKSIGTETETAMSITQRAMIVAADSAAYYDKSVEEVTETLQSFLKGNYENDAALNVSATETTRNAAANELYAKSFDRLTESQRADVLLTMVEAANEASGAMGQAAREADSWTNVTGELSEAWRLFLAEIGTPILEGLTPIIQGITGALQEYVELRNSLEGTNPVADEMTEAALAAESTAAAVQQLQIEYDSAREAARQSIDAQIGMFDKLELSSDTSTKQIISNWQSQQAGLANYADNLQKAINMGLDEALVQQLSDGSTQSMSILAALVNDTSINVDQINEEFRKTEEARDTVSNAMAAVQEDMAGKLGDMAAEVAKAWPGMAAQVGESIIEMQNYINSLTGSTVFVDVVTRYLNTGAPATVSTTQGYSAEPTSAYALPRNVPYLAEGAVIPPRSPFMAVLGDQPSGTNIEAPLETIKQAVSDVMDRQGGGDITINFTGDLAELARILTPEIQRETRNNQRAGGW